MTSYRMLPSYLMLASTNVSCSTACFSLYDDILSDDYWRTRGVGKSCAYCGRYAIEAHGNCEGCGAPLNRREVKPL